MKQLQVLILLLFSQGIFAAPAALLKSISVDNQQWPARYQLSLQIPENHHAYLNSGVEDAYLPIVVDPKHQLAKQGLKIDKLEKPQGVFDSEVQAQVLRHQGIFTVWLSALDNRSSRSTATIKLRYQLCNEETNICYRPRIAKTRLDLPDNIALAASSQTRQPEDDLSFMERLVELFKSNQGNTLYIFCLMLLAGLLSVATPCVYPMLPVTTMFIANRAQGHQGRVKYHAITYVIGIITTYALLGLVAGMTGGAFNSFMQSAVVNLAFAMFFAFFALSMLGFYEFSFMQNEVHSLDQHSARVSGYWGTWLMGGVAGLVISPCVGPIVFAMLLQVADNVAEKSAAMSAIQQTIGFWDKLTISAEGSIMMSGFGIGISIPFFILSVVKLNLPKAGYWMNKIKYGFGFVILYFAYGYFQKSMGILGVENTLTLMMAVGMVALWYSIVHCNILSLPTGDQQPSEKFHRFCGTLSLLVGSWLLISGLNHIPLVKQVVASTQTVSAQSVTSQTPQVEQAAGITWYRHFADAQKVALKTGKPIFIDFYASWCANCVAFKEATENNPALNEVLRTHAVTLKLIDKEPEFEQFKAMTEHRQLKIGLPYFAILSPNGKTQWFGTDYKAINTIVHQLTKIDADVLPGQFAHIGNASVS